MHFAPTALGKNCDAFISIWFALKSCNRVLPHLLSCWLTRAGDQAYNPQSQVLDMCPPGYKTLVPPLSTRPQLSLVTGLLGGKSLAGGKEEAPRASQVFHLVRSDIFSRGTTKCPADMLPRQLHVYHITLLLTSSCHTKYPQVGRSGGQFSMVCPLCFPPGASILLLLQLCETSCRPPSPLAFNGRREGRGADHLLISHCCDDH